MKETWTRSSKKTDEIKELTGGGVDMIYDLVGGDYAEPALGALSTWQISDHRFPPEY